MPVDRNSWYETPVLLGAKVRLEPPSSSHAAGYLAAADSDEVFEWMPVARPRSLSEAEETLAGLLARPDLQAWAQIDVASGEFAGMTTYYDVDPSMRTVAIGFTWLGQRFWRTGINNEAKLLLLIHAFETLGCVRVVWHTDIFNERSQAAITRLGATREGVLRKHRLRRDGSWRDTVTFSMPDDAWPAATAANRRPCCRPCSSIAWPSRRCARRLRPPTSCASLAFITRPVAYASFATPGTKS